MKSGAGVEAATLAPAHFKTILDRVRDAAIVVDREDRLIYFNVAGAELLRRPNGLGLADGRIHCTHKGADRRLRSATVAVCDGTAGRRTILLDDPAHPRLIVSLSPIEGTQGIRHALLVAQETGTTAANLEDPLRELFGLTPAETEIALRLAHGLTLAGIAARRGVTVQTIRTQVKALAAKLGCTRQAEIVALVRAIPAPPNTEKTE